MLKAMLLVTSMLVAAPVLAQDKPKAPESQPTQTAPAPATPETPATDDAAPDATTTQTATAPAPQTNPAPAPQTMQPVPAQPASPAAPATTQATTPQPAAAAQPAATQDQVAQAVGRDWAGFDKDANSQLDAAEFGAWMTSLRKAAEPAFVPGSPEAKTWESQAFGSADTDKNASVNKQELTAFLTPKPS